MSAGRNDPCPCGSGRKYKKCCLPQESAAEVVEAGWLRMRRTEGELIEKIARHLASHYGPDPIAEAWQDFTLWPEPPAERDEWPEFESPFLPWLLFDWAPDPYNPEHGGERPEIPPARHYAEYKGTSLDSYERRYIEEACRQPLTFFLVVAPEPGRRILLRDIFRQQEVTITERQASTTLRPGEIIFAKVVTLDGDSVMLGCAPYAIPSRHFDVIVDLRDRIAKHHEITAEVLRDFDYEIRDLYFYLREDVVNPAPPNLQNTDGDPLQMTRIEYDLDCSCQEAFVALLPLTLDDAGDFEEEIERDAQGDFVGLEFAWLRPGNAKNPGWPNTVLGHLELRTGTLTVNVNSQARAETIRAEIAARLGKQAKLKSTVIESAEQMMAARHVDPNVRAARDEECSELEHSPEAQALMAEMNAEHWRTWPDIPLPALRGQTPRQAAQTPDGRERLEVLLLDFSARNEMPQAFRPDIAALRRELGM